jgi:hypothetical protein
MFVFIVSHASSKENAIFNMSLCPVLNQSFEFFPLSCILLSYMAVVEWDIFCTEFSEMFFPWLLLRMIIANKHNFKLKTFRKRAETL